MAQNAHNGLTRIGAEAAFSSVVDNLAFSSVIDNAARRCVSIHVVNRACGSMAKTKNGPEGI